MPEQNPQGQGQAAQTQIQIKISDEILKGAYANQALITHTPTEFVLDFLNIFPGQGQGVVTSRVVTNPAHFKALLSAMQENLQKFESQFGKVDAAKPAAGHEFGFRTE